MLNFNILTLENFMILFLNDLLLFIILCFNEHFMKIMKTL